MLLDAAVSVPSATASDDRRTDSVQIKADLDGQRVSVGRQVVMTTGRLAWTQRRGVVVATVGDSET